MIKRIYSLVYCNEAAIRKYCYNLDLYKKGKLDTKPNISKVGLNINGEESDKFTLSEIDSVTSSFKDEVSFVKEVIPKSRIDKNKNMYIIYQSRGVRKKELIYDSNFMLHISNNIATRKRNGESNVLVDMSGEVSKYLTIIENLLFNGKGHSGFFNDKINDSIFNIKTAVSSSFDRSDSTLDNEQAKRYYINKFRMDIRQYSNFRDSFFYTKFKSINIDEVLFGSSETNSNESEDVLTEDDIREYADVKGLSVDEVKRRMSTFGKNNCDEQMNLFDSENSNISTEKKDSKNINESKYIIGEQVTLEGYFGDDFGGNAMSKKI